MAKVTVPYFCWRDGRPRWIPGPALRARGYKGRDLKAASGAWLGYGDAVEAAQAINEAITDQAQAAPAPAVENRTLSALFDRLRKSPKFQGVAGDSISNSGKLSPISRAAYLQHFAILEIWAGDLLVDQIPRDSITEFYFDQKDARGVAMANAILRSLKMALFYARDELEWIARNRASKLAMVTPDGRCEIFEPEEIGTILAAADWCGLHSIGDAFVVGALAGQRKADILALPEGDMPSGHYAVKQRKRGAIAFVPLTAPLLARVTAMRARKADAAPGVRHTLEIINTLTGKPYNAGAKEFDRQWRLVRAVAAGDAKAIAQVRAERKINSMDLPFTPIKAVAGKFFSDLRDTAVTLLFMAGCSVAEVANITGHSLKTVEAVLDKHYFKRNAELAKSAGVKLDAYLQTANIRWA